MTMTTMPVALVTGATSGIGQAAALALAEAGFEVIGTGRNTARIAARDAVTYVDLDVSSDESVAGTIQKVIERFGRVDVLINNAGIGSAGAAEESSIAQARHIFDVNVFGVMRMTKAVLPHMRAQGGGRVINLSSVLGFLPAPYAAVYAASKHAIEGYSESMDHEVREHGVRVLLIEPAYTKTGFDANLVQPDAPLPLYDEQRRIVGEVNTTAIESGDDPATVAQVIVAAIIVARTDRAGVGAFDPAAPSLGSPGAHHRRRRDHGESRRQRGYHHGHLREALVNAG